MDKRIPLVLIIIIVVLVGIVLAVYFSQEKGYRNEYTESGIIFKSDYNIPEIIQSYADSNYWTLYLDLSDPGPKGNEYSCGLWAMQVLRANNYDLLVLGKDTKNDVSFCIGYDSKSRSEVKYSWNECQEVLSKAPVLLAFDSKNSKDEIILDKGKIKISATKENGYAVCKYFLDIYFNTDVVGESIASKIQKLNTDNIVNYKKIQNK